MSNEILSAAVINFNGANTLVKTIDSIYASEGVQVEVFIIDDCSTDNSLAMVKKKYPEIEIIQQSVNTKNLNKNRNLALRKIESERLFLTDNDILFDKKALYELNRVMDDDPQTATCTPRLMYWDEPGKVYTDGTTVHFIGGAITPNRNKIVKDFPVEIRQNSGTGIMLIDRQKALDSGLFDEDVLMMGWGDDGEFYQRLLRFGYNCWYVSTAFASHEDKPFNALRQYRALGQIYNRWALILSHYSSRTLILLVPPFILYEVLQFLFMTMKKMPQLYFSGNWKVIKNLSKIMEKRKFIQNKRTVADKHVLHSGEIYVSPVLLKNKILYSFNKGLSTFFDFYWKLVLPFMEK